jgi:hypothetical protein
MHHADVDEVAQILEVGLIRLEFVVDVKAPRLSCDSLAHEHEAVVLTRAVLMTTRHHADGFNSMHTQARADAERERERSTTKRRSVNW